MRQRTRDRSQLSLHTPPQVKANAKTSRLPAYTQPPWLLFSLGGIALLLALTLIIWSVSNSSTMLTTQAKVAARTGDWSAGTSLLEDNQRHCGGAEFFSFRGSPRLPGTWSRSSS